MPDLRTLLHDAAHATPVTPAAALVHDDLVRARRALIRSRRTRHLALPTGLVAAAAVGVAVLAQGIGAGSAPVGALPPSGRPPGASTVATAPGPSGTPGTPAADLSRRIALVGYRGTQPVGFTIARVPQGWQVQAVDAYHLLVAPEGTADADPNSFDGKILIGRANENEIAVERHDVQEITVGGVRARLFVFDGEGTVAAGDRTQGLLLPVRGGKAYLIFQLPGSLHWDAATVADFAAGVRLTSQARAAAG